MAKHVEAPFKVTFEEIGPAEAQELLDTAKNIRYTTAGGIITSNRKVNPGRVARYTSDIQNGYWEPTHQGIALDTEGNLMDGQHRLAAIVASGVPVTLMVCKGVSPETFWLMDGGYTRTAQSFLDGKYGQQRAAMCKVLMTIEKAGGTARISRIALGDTGGYSTAQVLHYLSQTPSIQEYGEGYGRQAGRAGRSGKFGTSTVGLMLGGYLAGPDKWGLWWEQIDDLLTGRGVDPENPLGALFRVEAVGGNMTAVNYMRAIYVGVKYRDDKPLRRVREDNIREVQVF